MMFDFSFKNIPKSLTDILLAFAIICISVSSSILIDVYNTEWDSNKQVISSIAFVFGFILLIIVIIKKIRDEKIEKKMGKLEIKRLESELESKELERKKLRSEIKLGKIEYEKLINDKKRDKLEGRIRLTELMMNRDKIMDKKDREYITASINKEKRRLYSYEKKSEKKENKLLFKKIPDVEIVGNK